LCSKSFSRQSGQFYKWLWKAKIPRKTKLILWPILQNSLPISTSFDLFELALDVHLVLMYVKTHIIISENFPFQGDLMTTNKYR